MCMKCGCCTPNDKKIGPQNFGSNGGSGSQVVVKPTDTSSNGKLI
jgi:hypothetical protein